jgi:4-hydroxybenzoate polyprenyltransferase
LLRIEQWSKNLFVFAPIFFATKITLLYQQPVLIESFLLFCLTASIIYILNDIKDVESDRLHPEKCKRPIASGAITKRNAYLIIAAFFSLIVFINIILPAPAGVLILLGAYFVMNLGYIYFFKKIALVDIVFIATGFIIRILVGGAASGVFISKWIILITFTLAMFLAIGKRRNDFVVGTGNLKDLRHSLGGYNLALIDVILVQLSTICIICYIMYSVSEDVIKRIGSDYIYITALPVIFGFLRYFQVIYVYHNSGSPTKILLKDKPLQAILALWLLLFAVIIYLKSAITI